jgi:trans-2,3-dihydro-3-hydroxyanthranilate isomerase
MSDEAPRRPYTVLDVFTETPLTGNALAVVHDADELDDETMLAFARETRLSETSFIQTAAREEADYRNRIFTVSGEVPFAGHPSLGAAVAVARHRGVEEARYVQETGAGLQPVDVQVSNGGGAASMLQEPPTLGAAADAAEVMTALGLTSADADPQLGPQVASTGLPVLLAPVAEAAAVSGAVPDFDALDALLAPHGTLNLYLAHCDLRAGRVRARMFSRLVEEGEDPATGSAAGALCAYLAEHAGVQRVEIAQGVEMRRPSALVAEVEGDRVRVSGGVVAVIDGTVELS